MDYMKLADETQITIEDGASLDRIVHVAENEADAQAACMAVREAGNLDHVEFYNEGAEEPYGVYDHLILKTPVTRQDNEDGTVTVLISLREKTDLEKRVDALEEGQEIQDGAIEDIGMVLSDIAEG